MRTTHANHSKCDLINHKQIVSVCQSHKKNCFSGDCSVSKKSLYF